MANKAAIMLPLITLALIILVSGEQNDLKVSYWTGYENDTWVGQVTFVFPDTTDCLFSVHYQARRIDHDNLNSNEYLLLDCGGQDATVTLRIEDLTYDYVQLYTCMQDNTQKTNWTWLIANPMLSAEGEMSLGSQMTFTCVSFLTAEIYWVFPGLDTDNNDIVIDEFNSGNNYTTTATFQLQMKHNYAVIQCCMQLREGQKTEQPCDAYRIVVDNSIQLVSTYENYQNFTRVMQCVFRSPNNDYQQILWFYCQSTGTCSDIGTSNYENIYDDLYQTLTTTAVMVDRSDHYICSYLGVNHTFIPAEQNYAPKIVSTQSNVTFSEVYVFSAEVIFDAFPAPHYQWTKTSVNKFQNGSTIISPDDPHYLYVNAQIGETRYVSKLFIPVYYTPDDNNIYTFTANNSLGQHSVSMNTTYGPYSIQMIQVTGGTSCLMYGFPFPLPNTLRLLSPNEVEYSVEIHENSAQMYTNFTILYSVGANDYPFTISCCTFNQFDYDNKKCEHITIDS